MQIGRKIYYELATGYPIVDTGERSGDVVETTQEQDFESYKALSERNPEMVGCLQLAYGQYAQDFTECIGFRVDVSGNEQKLIFSYPDPQNPGQQIEQPVPLSVQVAQLKGDLIAAQEAINMLLGV